MDFTTSKYFKKYKNILLLLILLILITIFIYYAEIEHFTGDARRDDALKIIKRSDNNETLLKSIINN